MKGARWLALTVGGGLGLWAGCFTAPDLTGPYLCVQGTCPESNLVCVGGVCCDPEGGFPTCSQEPPDGGPPDGGMPDGGMPDGGSPDGGKTDAGADGGGGCVVTPPFDCTVSGQTGACAVGVEYCDDAGVYHCDPVNAVTETCNNQDDDCDGVADNYPCGGPASFLAPDAEYLVNALKRPTSVGGQPQGCVSDEGGLTDEWWDAGHWRVRGLTTHVLHAEKADGGTWDLSKPGRVLLLTFAGATVQGNRTQLFESWNQPTVMLCGPNGGWRRYQPKLRALMRTDGGTFSMSTGIDLQVGGVDWNIDPGIGTSPTFNLAAISDIEILLDPYVNPDGGIPGWDAGVLAFGFFP